MNSAQPDYNNWTTADFLADTSFQIWVKQSLAGNTASGPWQSLLQRFPHLRIPMQEARDLLEIVYTQRSPETDPEGKALVWQALTTAMAPAKRRRSLLFTWKNVAAVMVPLIMIAASIYFVYSHENNVIVQSPAVKGAFRVVLLPDASQVMLGANSNIRYSKNWGQQKREVWLSGDAHFEVKHLNHDSARISEPEKFVVYVNDSLQIDVLGTVFNVWNKNGKTSVELESGSVRLKMKNKEPLFMKPGEVAIIEKGNISIRRNEAPVFVHEEAIEKVLELNNTSVREIIAIIEKTYGKKVVVEDESILNRRIDGVLPLCHENDLLFALSGILDVQVETKADNILVIRKSE